MQETQTEIEIKIEIKIEIGIGTLSWGFTPCGCCIFLNIQPHLSRSFFQSATQRKINEDVINK